MNTTTAVTFTLESQNSAKPKDLTLTTLIPSTKAATAAMSRSIGACGHQ